MLEILSKKISRATGLILNSTRTYLILIFIVLIQFLLVSIIYFQNKKLAETLSRMESEQTELKTSLNGLQSGFMQLQAQFYRLRSNQ